MFGIKMYNPLKMPDWGIRKFLGSILAIQLAVWVILGLEAIGLQIPLIRQLIPIIYLTYVPGVLILRVLKVHRISAIESLLYSVGLSIATVMFIGFFMNIVYPLIGIARPFSVMPLSITISTVVLLLCFISYIRDRDFSDPHHIDIKEFFSPPVLLLCLLPVLSILGTLLVNIYDNNIVLMSLIVIIGGVVILIGLNKFVPRNLYPLAVFVIGLSLLFHRSLISMYVSGSDIHHEYFLANNVVLSGIWDFTVSSVYNTLLSITTLAPSCSIICNISLTWVFKIVYPLVFSLAPLGLYRIFREQTDDKVAFLSCFLFMAVFQFNAEMPTVLRQEIGFLFFVLLIMLIINKALGAKNKIFLMIVFGASLAVSHYALTVIFAICVVFTFFVLVSLDFPWLRKFKRHLSPELPSDEYAGYAVTIGTEKTNKTILLSATALFAVFAVIWYFFVADSAVFDGLVNLVKVAINKTAGNFLNTATSQGLSIITTTREFSLDAALNTIIDYLNQLLMILGVLVLFLKGNKLRVTLEYLACSVVMLFIIFAGIFIPYFSIALSMHRLYFIALTLLAPFVIIGAITAFRIVNRGVMVLWKNREIPYRFVTTTIAVYLVIFLLYQTGFVYELTRGYSGSLSISQEGILKYGTNYEKGILYSAITREEDALSAEWLAANRDPSGQIYATYNDIRVHTLLSYGMIPIEEVPVFSRETGAIPPDAYVYLQSINVVEGLGVEFHEELMNEARLSYFDIAEISYHYEKKNLIYTNGGSKIYQ